jgi:hypothetical protein
MAETPAPERPVSASTTTTAPLSCPVCHSRLLQLLDAEPHLPGGWDVLLECPECWSLIEEHLDDHEVDDFDREFDEGTRQLVEELRRLTAEHMREDVDRFLAALEADAIQPMDF